MTNPGPLNFDFLKTSLVKTIIIRAVNCDVKKRFSENTKLPLPGLLCKVLANNPAVVAEWYNTLVQNQVAISPLQTQVQIPLETI